MLNEAATRAYEKILETLPQTALAIAIVGAGLLFASLLYFITVRLLTFFAIDKLAGKTPIERILRSVGITKNVSNILGLLVFWLVVLLTLVFAADALRMEQVSHALAVVTRYIPQVIGALLTIIFGLLLARFLQVFVEQTLTRARMKFAEAVGRIVYIISLIIVAEIVIEQLGFHLGFVTTNFLIVLCSVFVIVGFGVVVASRTLLENALACHQLRQLVMVGSEVEVDGVHGTVINYTMTSVILQSADSEVVLPALTFFTNSYVLKRSHGGK